MINLNHQELSETKTPQLPDASLEVLKSMREDMCSTKSSRDFKLQPNQRFLRRVMSPDSPTRNIMLVHGTGVGKSCSAIQIAEEYIVRPEFQDKRVLILANPSVQENFRSQIFNVSKVSVDKDGLILSKQCTGRKYLDILERIYSEPLKYSDKNAQEKVMAIVSKLISEFYEFQGYDSFANSIDRQKINLKSANVDKWIHETFDNRLIIVDEAHNLRDTTESTQTPKIVGEALKQILGTADGVILVLLTATPMYDQYDELLYYFNLFLLNDRSNQVLQSQKIFTKEGAFLSQETEQEFRLLCQKYISYVKGENPFTFPFRLYPPDERIAKPDRTQDIFGKKIDVQRKFLVLTKSFVSPQQQQAIENLKVTAVSQHQLICAYPENKEFSEVFDKSSEGFSYKSEKFLSPSKVPLYSSKFGLIMSLLKDTKGIVFVYSNIVEEGAQLFAMCLEEHGYSNAIGNSLFKKTSEEIKPGTKGKYVLFTSKTTDIDIRKTMIRLKRPDNKDGSDIRVIIASPKVSEGVDFANVRQIHILDPWFNMSRIEQVLGRAMRTCSHSSLPFEEQNCTVYLHVCRFPEPSKKETVDEFIYRTFVEEKAIKIAKVKKAVMESAMDCPLQQNINNLPVSWRLDLKIPQFRAEDNKQLELSIFEMSAPTFLESVEELECKIQPSKEDPNHERPLSAILDVKDEILDKLLKVLLQKPIWSKKDLFQHAFFKQYSEETLSYILQNAIDSGFQLKDKYGRLGRLQAKKNVFAFTIDEHNTMQERFVKEEISKDIEIPEYKPEKEPEKEPETVSEKEPEKEETETVSETERETESKKEERSLSKYRNPKIEFSDEIQDWVTVDTLLSDKERKEHLLNLDWTNLPPYAKPLVIEDKFMVLGKDEMYSKAKTKVELIGRDKDSYLKWLGERKQNFIDTYKNNRIFASMKSKKLIFNYDKTNETELTRTKTSKTIGGQNCLSFKIEEIKRLAQQLGLELPDSLKTKPERCIYINYIIRQATLVSPEKIAWITPEEFEIFNSPKISEEIRSKL